MKRATIAKLTATTMMLPLAAAIAAPQEAQPAKVQPVTTQDVQPSDALSNPKTAEPVEKLPVWQAEDVEELLSYIDVIHKHGLTAADYDPAGLRAVIATGDQAQVSAAATQRFEELAHDLALGHAGEKARIDWHIVDPDLEREGMLRYLTEKALYDNAVTATLDGLMPTHPQYAALKKALSPQR